MVCLACLNRQFASLNYGAVVIALKGKPCHIAPSNLHIQGRIRLLSSNVSKQLATKETVMSTSSADVSTTKFEKLTNQTTRNLDDNKQNVGAPVGKNTVDSLKTSSPSSGTVISVNVAAHPAHHYISGGLPCDPKPPPFFLAEYGEGSLYSLVLLRHGESEWNSQNRYTGWCDVALTQAGKNEARTAGRLLKENGILIDQAFTSVLRRASSSCNMALTASDQHWIPITKTWRLNERHYGALQGYNKDTAWKELGIDQELVMQMRRSYDVRPPRMDDDHPYWHGNDRRYVDLTPDQLERSRGESLKDAAARIMPFYNSVIVPAMQAGKTCLIVAHANTIRTLIKHIDRISDEDIKGMTIPTGIPLLYRLDKYMKPVDPLVELEFRYMVEPKGFSWGTSRAHGFHGVYLGDLARLQEIQRKRDATNRDWQRIILRNIGKSLGWDMETMPDGSLGSCSKSIPISPSDPSNVVETRQLWWLVHNKLKAPEYKNMLLLLRMEEALETVMHSHRRKFTTKFAYESLINKIHLDTEGCVVEPFVDLACRQVREERQKMWSEALASEIEEECLIR